MVRKYNVTTYLYVFMSSMVIIPYFNETLVVASPNAINIAFDSHFEKHDIAEDKNSLHFYCKRIYWSDNLRELNNTR